MIADIARQIALGHALQNVEQFLCKFVSLNTHQLKLITLWVVHTHALDAFDFTPYLNIYSPLPECGKTRCLEAIEPLVVSPWMTGWRSCAKTVTSWPARAHSREVPGEQVPHAKDSVAARTAALQPVGRLHAARTSPSARSARWSDTRRDPPA